MKITSKQLKTFVMDIVGLIFSIMYILAEGRGEWRGWTWRCSCVTALTVYEMDIILLFLDPEEQMFLQPCNS